jgi:AraC-like DNA-binding protein
MMLWISKLVTVGPRYGLPLLHVVAQEVRNDTSYHLEGKYRQNDETFLFKYSLSGTGCFRDATGEHRVEPGSGFLCEVRDPETAYYYPEWAREEWKFLWITFSGGEIRPIVRGLLANYGPVYFLSRDSDTIRGLLRFRHREEEENILAASQSSRVVLDLLHALAESKENYRRRDPDNLLARRAAEWIGAHLEENINVTDLSRALEVSREHLSRVFGRYVGSSPYRYIARQKCLAACRLLKDTNLTGKEISARLGYDTPAHFNRVFKHTIDMTPMEFRQSGVVQWV